IAREIITAQPTVRRAAAHRRLIDASCKTRRRERGQCANITGPRDAEEIARSAVQARHLDMAAEALETPVEGAQQPGHAVFIGRARRTPPLVRGIEEPHAGESERLRNPRNL